MEKRPAFHKYAKSFPMFIIKWPLRIGNKVYTLKDYPLLLLGNLAIIVAMFFLYDYAPFTLDFYRDEAIIGVVILGILLSAAYWLFFIYRFGRFNITWADKTEHPYPDAVEGYDCYGEQLPSNENEHAALKSRGVFTAFVAGIGVLITAYIMLGFCMAHIRILHDHKQDLEKLIEISNKYDFLIIEGPNEAYVSGLTIKDSIGYKVTQQEQRELAKLFQKLQIDYVNHISKGQFNQDEKTYILLNCKAASGWLIWDPITGQWVYEQEHRPNR